MQNEDVDFSLRLFHLDTIWCSENHISRIFGFCSKFDLTPRLLHAKFELSGMILIKSNKSMRVEINIGRISSPLSRLQISYLVYQLFSDAKKDANPFEKMGENELHTQPKTALICV